MLFERKILVGLEIRCKKRSPFGKCVFNLGVESTVLRVTPGTEASQAMAGSFCAPKKTRKMQKSRKTDHTLESTLLNPRPQEG